MKHRASKIHTHRHTQADILKYYAYILRYISVLVLVRDQEVAGSNPVAPISFQPAAITCFTVGYFFLPAACRWFPATGGLASGEKLSRPDSFPVHFVYILYSPSLDRLYVGETADPAQRLKRHLAGHQRYTRRAADWIQVYLG
jgi:hypothetical protein